MKKYLLLFAFSAMAVTSCEDDDIQNYELDMLKGEWKTSKFEVISGKDNKTVLYTETPSGCAAKDLTEFRTDYYTSYTAYSGVGATCTSTKTEGTFTYDSETKELIITYNQSGPEKFIITILSNSELRIMQTQGNVDLNGDMVNDPVYVTYTK
ncbi:lipocalin family protein [Chryseobacterium sp. GMJ5]|uniref:Lipocalin family protein n=1 Tax=Chryseobacterium gilvum TaxID=2976534 RepID=A0ABT2VTT3_9FLAO|nr:lipocalin family protein [Chryseobacterium gilvum]MCU7613396.1 lipocalin family protein [Chryseobacterium gilvum]